MSTELSLQTERTGEMCYNYASGSKFIFTKSV